MVGNPFRRASAVDPVWPHFKGGIIPELAHAIYYGGNFQRIPALAKTLEEAGCTDQELLSHCHDSGPHVPGCWVLDLILGKSRMLNERV
jgi:hypothetical protein